MKRHKTRIRRTHSGAYGVIHFLKVSYETIFLQSRQGFHLSIHCIPLLLRSLHTLAPQVHRTSNLQRCDAARSAMRLSRNRCFCNDNERSNVQRSIMQSFLYIVYTQQTDRESVLCHWLALNSGQYIVVK